MRITTAAEQRALAPRSTNLTMLAYQQPAMMRDGWKPPTVGHIPGPSKPKKDYGIKSHHPTVYPSKAAKQEAFAKRTKLKQSERLKLVVAKHSKFDRYQAAQILKVTPGSMKDTISYWVKLNMIKHTGEYGKFKSFIWEAV